MQIVWFAWKVEVYFHIKNVKKKKIQIVVCWFFLSRMLSVKYNVFWVITNYAFQMKKIPLFLLLI